MWERSSLPQAFSRTRRVFHLARGCAISDRGRYRPHFGLHVVNPELGSGVDYMEPPEAFSEEPRQLESERTEQLKKLDERLVSRFEPAGIVAILRAHGFCTIEDINFQEIASRFSRAVQGLAPGHLGVHVVHAKH